METIKLKNNTEEFEPLVNVTFMTLSHLFQEEPIVCYELVMKARNPHHACFGNTGTRLKSMGLLGQSGSMHDSVRNIVLSSFQGDGLDMTLVSPKL